MTAQTKPVGARKISSAVVALTLALPGGGWAQALGARVAAADPAPVAAQAFSPALPTARLSAAALATPPALSAGLLASAPALLPAALAPELDLQRAASQVGPRLDRAKASPESARGWLETLPDGARRVVSSFLTTFSRGAARIYEYDDVTDVTAPFRKPKLLPEAEPPRGRKASLIDTTHLRVPADRLRWKIDASQLPESTEDVAPESGLVIGQERGERALRDALRLCAPKAGVFVAGEKHLGKATAAVGAARRLARGLPPAPDLIHLSNFSEDPESGPALFSLPAGEGHHFITVARSIIGSLEEELPGLIKSQNSVPEYRALMQKMETDAAPKIAALSTKVNRVGVLGGYKLKVVFDVHPGGFELAIGIATPEGKILSPRDAAAVTEDLRARGIKNASSEQVLKDYAQKTERFWSETEAIVAPYGKALEEMNSQEKDRTHAAVADFIQRKIDALDRIVDRLEASASGMHEDEAHRRLEAESEARIAAHEREIAIREAQIEEKLAKFRSRVTGFGLSVVEMKIEASAEAGTPATTRKIVLLTFEGKSLSQKNVREAAQAAHPELFPEGKPVPEVLAELSHEILQEEEAAAVMRENEALASDDAEQVRRLEAWYDRSHDALHEHDAVYQLEKWVDSFYIQLLENYEEFLPASMDESKAKVKKHVAELMGMPPPDADPAEDYRFRVLVDNSLAEGAPVVVAKDYTWQAWFGAAKRDSGLKLGPRGLMDSSSSLEDPDMQAGYLQKAHGGFLIADADELIDHPETLHGLLEMLGRGEAVFAEDGVLSLVYGSGSRHAVPNDAKVVLTGSPWTLFLLRYYLPGFDRAFPLIAEFEGSARSSGPRAAQVISGYAVLMRNIVDARRLRHFSRGAMAVLLENASRDAESNERLSLAHDGLGLLMQRASMRAGDRRSSAAATRSDQGSALVEADDVRLAIAEIEEQEVVGRDTLYGMIANGTFWIDVDGRKKNTITGMAVIGEVRAHGIPARVTVVTAASKDGDIIESTEERAKIVGSSFVQSVGNVGAYFKNVLGRLKTLPFQATVKFEQNYGGIDGDSATQTMTYLVGASLADVPLRQDVAITGSMDQHGNIQVIGGLNHKIAGAWDVYREIRRRRGEAPSADRPYHILMPAANIRDLALREDVAQAVEDGRLVLVPIVHVSQGFEFLTGIPYSKLIKKWGKYRAEILQANKPKKSKRKK